MTDTRRRADVLVEALPYIRRFAGKTVVVKYGGNAIAGTSEHDALDVFAQDIVLMRLVGMRPVVVHGGGPQISALMGRLGKTAEFRDGLRVTDAETVDIARMVLVGQVNPQLVAAINAHGNYAVGVSGGDAGLLRATPHDGDLGFVGNVDAVNPRILEGLLADEFIPVVATIGTDEAGQAYNINADTVAAAIAEALGAEKLVYLTDVEGLRRDVDDPASLIHQTTADELEQLIAAGVDHRRDDPQGHELHPRRAPRRAPCPHPRREGSPRAAAGDLHRRGHRHGDRRRQSMSNVFAAVGLAESPFMPVFAATAADVRPRPGHRAVRRRRQALPRLPVGDRRHVARSRQPGGGRGDLGAGQPSCSTSATTSPTRRRPPRRSPSTSCSPTPPDSHGRVFFANSGAEAIECAIKLARKHGGRGRHTVVSAFGSFHGRTLAALAATGQPSKHEPFQPMPEGFRHVAWGDVDAVTAAVDGTVAAVLIEPILGEGGVHPAPAGYLAAIRRLCDETGALMIVDEIQTGHGPHRPLVRLRARRRRPRRRHAGQGARQRHAGRRLLGPRRRRRRVRAGRPRQHLQRHGDRHGGGQRRDRRDAPHRRPGRRGQAGRAAGDRARRPCLASRRCAAAGLLLAAELDGRPSGDVAGELLDHGLVVNAVTPTALRLAPPITVTDAEIDEALAILDGGAR